MGLLLASNLLKRSRIQRRKHLKSLNITVWNFFGFCAIQIPLAAVSRQRVVHELVYLLMFHLPFGPR
jgi:hypothetical protein